MTDSDTTLYTCGECNQDKTIGQYFVVLGVPSIHKCRECHDRKTESTNKDKYKRWHERREEKVKSEIAAYNKVRERNAREKEERRIARELMISK